MSACLFRSVLRTRPIANRVVTNSGQESPEVAISRFWITERRFASAESDISTPRQLYKYLVKETTKLPPEAAKFYKDSIKRGFSQHVDETDPERIRQIMGRAIEDAQWIVKKVLLLYRRLLRLSRTWQARDPNETQTERQYIRDETRKLFRENKGVTSPLRISEHIREAEARLTMAEHYRNPYPRPVNLPPGSYSKKAGKKEGIAIEKLNQMSKPIYVKSIDETVKKVEKRETDGKKDASESSQ